MRALDILVTLSVCLSVILSISDFEDPFAFTLEMGAIQQSSPLNVACLFFFNQSYFREKASRS